SYTDSPFDGATLIGKVLMNDGFRVGIIAQPALDSSMDIGRLGEPALFWGVTAGGVDSMVANYTATKKFRNTDDFTPGGRNHRRPDRAVIVYTNLIRRYFKSTVPVVLGGIEASLRRIAHYDYWDNRVRRSVLLDAKADYLVYGMGEKTVIRLADALKHGKDPRDIPGLCYRSKAPPEGFHRLPSFESAARDGAAFTDMFKAFAENADPTGAVGLFQRHGDQGLVQTPPPHPLSTPELDRIYELDFERDLHPYYRPLGTVRALDTVRFSITSHRGCFGGCRFCAISVHQGRRVYSRSRKSILAEVKRLALRDDFRGIIQDVGGPTANMYGIECDRKAKEGSCRKRQCLVPTVCPKLDTDHRSQIDLLQAVRRVPGVKSVFVASGIRYDLLMADTRSGADYLTNLAANHVSGQLKVAPEHSSPSVLALMGKPDIKVLDRFKVQFDAASRRCAKRQFLTYYLMAAHPGCRDDDMEALRRYAKSKLKLTPEQVQIFTPTPSTWSALMYHLKKDPFTGRALYVETTRRGKERQKARIVGRGSTDKKPRTSDTRTNPRTGNLRGVKSPRCS
ncbi:MAG: YgiQ family radical SAM protein, partial [Desulfobacterales bacterium]